MKKGKGSIKSDWSHRHWSARPMFLREWRRRHRWLVRSIFAVPLLAFLALVILTRTPLTKRIVVDALRDTTGMEVSASGAFIRANGTLVIDELDLELPGLRGPAAELVHVRRVEAKVDWFSGLWFRPRVLNMKITEPVLRISQSTEDYVVNIENIPAPGGAGGGGGMGGLAELKLPPIEVENAGIEIGEHNQDRFTLLRRVQMDGWLKPSAKEAGDFSFQLHETAKRVRRPGGEPEEGFVVDGTSNGGVIDVRVSRFTLDDWPLDSVSSRLRTVYEGLNLTGNVPEARLRYSRDLGIEAELRMRGVGMNLPIEPTEFFEGGAEGMQGPLPRYVRMRDVEGSIRFARDNVRATIEGNLEDLRYAVELAYNGLTEDAPFECEFFSEDFRLERSPRLLPYAPPKVKEWLTLFSSPEASVTTDMRVWREAPVDGQPAEIQAQGVVRLKDGRAAFHKFPYEFTSLDGEFRFDSNHVEIVRVAGRSAAGAEMSATGWIEPLDDTAEVRVDVRVRNVSIDAAMEEAFGPERRELMPTLFNRERYQELIAAGLVQTREQAAAAAALLAQRTGELATADGEQAEPIRAQIESLKRRAGIPVFELGGRADVDVGVLSPRGEDSGYLVSIDIRIAEAGLLPEKCPIPIHGKNVSVRVETDRGWLEGGEFEFLGGGTASVEAKFLIPDDEQPDARPDIRVQVGDLPLSELLIHALPIRQEAEEVKRVLRDLRTTGLADGEVHIRTHDDQPGAPLGFDADFALRGAGAWPRPVTDEEVIGVEGVRGRITASERMTTVDLTGRIAAPGIERQGRAAAGGDLSVRMVAWPPDPASGRARYEAVVQAPGVDLEAPHQTLARVFSGTAADRIAALRREHRPSGRADVEIEVASSNELEHAAVAASFVPVSEVGFDVLDGRLSLSDLNGRAVVRSFDRVWFAAEGLTGRVAYDGADSGRVRLDGALRLSSGDPQMDGPEMLRATLTDGRIESPLLWRILEQRLSVEHMDDVARARVRGAFDASVMVRNQSELGVDAPGALEVTTLFRPRSLQFEADGTPVELNGVSGEIEIDGGSGIVRDLTARAAEWSMTANGAWETGADGSLVVSTQISGTASQLTPDLRAVLPAELRGLLDQIRLRIQGPLTMTEGMLTLGRGIPAAGDWTRFGGAFTYTDASVDVGLELSDMTGRLDVSYQREGADGPPRFTIGIDADHLSSAGVQFGASRATVRNGEHRGEVIVPLAAGECYGGRFSARARVGPPPDGGGSEFAADAQLSGVRFAPLLADLTAGMRDAQAANGGPVEEEPEADRSDHSRGLMDAELSLSGLTGAPETRRGRGSMRINGGRVLNFPFMTRLIEVSNLTLPGNARLDYARSSFYIDAGVINFEDLSAFSESVQILGYGTMTWPGKILNLRFNSRSARPIPVLSFVVQGIRDEFVTASVRGKLGDHDVMLEQFPGTRRFLGRAMGAPRSEQSQLLERVRQRAAGIPPTTRLELRGIPATPQNPERPALAAPQTSGPDQ